MGFAFIFGALLLGQPARGGESDCNSNGVADPSDIAGQTSADCNSNNIPDECDLVSDFTYTQDTDSAIPDTNPGEVSSLLDVTESRVIDKLRVRLQISHTWNGDLRCELKHVPSGTTIVLFDRIGVPEANGGYGFDSNGFDVFLADTFPLNIDVDTAVFGGDQVVVGDFEPFPGMLSAFEGLNAQGMWELKVIDVAAVESGTLLSWSLVISEKNSAVDCDADEILDACELVENDCDGNQVPDNCQTDSDGDGRIDPCDLCEGYDDALDDDFDGVPDGCDVCPGFDDTQNADGDAAPDGCDGCPQDPLKIAPGACGCGQPDVDTDGDTVLDCDDVCPGEDDRFDCDGDMVPDSCDTEPDCNLNGVPDNCDLMGGTSQDCNSNSIPDSCDIASGTSEDCVRNGIPDECEPEFLAAAGADFSMRPSDPPKTLGGIPTAVNGLPPHTYQWSIEQGPSTSGISDPTVANPTFSPTLGGTYIIKVVVRDASVPPCERMDTVVATVLALNVDAGIDRAACVGTPSTPLGGFPTVTGGTPPYSYEWFVIAGPSPFGLSNRQSSNPTFTPTFEDLFELRVNVTDSGNPTLSGSDTVVVRGLVVRANAGVDRTIEVDSITDLGAAETGSTGIPPYSYAWSLTTNPGGAGQLNSTSAANPTFNSAAAGTFVAQVIVTDSTGCIGVDSVVIIVVPEGSDGPPPGPNPNPFPDLCGMCGGTGQVMGVALFGSFGGLLALRRRGLSASMRRT
ncbi:MAG: proprotein convertase P-domain-containing protein [Phycisphaerae bacterium]|nr:proprotein convertase P-domain-containing protein [Phycisphaerae bacterium]